MIVSSTKGVFVWERDSEKHWLNGYLRRFIFQSLLYSCTGINSFQVQSPAGRRMLRSAADRWVCLQPISLQCPGDVCCSAVEKHRSRNRLETRALTVSCAQTSSAKLDLCIAYKTRIQFILGVPECHHVENNSVVPIPLPSLSHGYRGGCRITSWCYGWISLSFVSCHLHLFFPPFYYRSLWHVNIADIVPRSMGCQWACPSCLVQLQWRTASPHMHSHLQWFRDSRRLY